MDNKLSNDRHGASDVIVKKVGVFSVVGMFYALCCAGAYGVEEMVPELGPGLTIAMLIVLPFFWALPYSYIISELGSARPVEGGKLLWVKEALGEFWFGIMAITNCIWGLVANTVYVVLSVSYLGTVIEMNNYQAYALKVGLIIIFFIVNVLGIKEVSIVSTILSVAVMLAFLTVTVIGFSHMNSNPFVPFMSEEYGGNLFMTLGAGLAIGIWMYSGFDDISLVAGEIKDSYKVIPRALMIVIPLMILTYVLPTLAGLGSIGNWESWTTEPSGIGYHTVLAEYAPKAVGVIFVVIAIIGQCSIYNMCVTAASRSPMILADENLGPKVLAKLSNSRGTPVVSLVIVLVVTIALLGLPNKPLDFTFLVVIDVFFSVVVCALTVVSAFILKRRIAPKDVPFKAPGGIAGHTIMALVCLFFCVAIVLLNGTDYFLGGFAVMLFIPILYVLGKLKFKGLTVKEPETYPIDKRTGLAFGDFSRLGFYYIGLGLFAVLARFFLHWYELDWGVEYYIEEYETGVFSDFYAMLLWITVLGLISLAAGIGLWLAGNRLKIQKTNS